MADIRYLMPMPDIRLEDNKYIQLEEEGHIQLDENIDVPDTQDVWVDSLVNKKNAHIRLSNLIFEPGTHFLHPEANTEIERIKDFMLQNPTTTIQIQGHICCRNNGDDGYDPETQKEDLSVQRAKQVYLYLKKGGISKDRMTYVGLGGSRKIIKDDFTNPKAAQINMRVEIKIISE